MGDINDSLPSTDQVTRTKNIAPSRLIKNTYPIDKRLEENTLITIHKTNEIIVNQQRSKFNAKIW